MGDNQTNNMVCAPQYTQAAANKSDSVVSAVNGICGADYQVVTWYWTSPAGFSGRTVEPHVAVYTKDSTVPAQEPFEPEGGSSNPHTAEKGCLALFHIWDGDQCFNEEFRSKFDECIASAGVANMADEIRAAVPEILAPIIPQPVLEVAPCSNMDSDLQQVLGDFFDQIDMMVTKDGQLSQEELAKVLGEDMAKQCITAFDNNGDKQLTKEEWIEGGLQEAQLESDGGVQRIAALREAINQVQEDSTM